MSGRGSSVRPGWVGSQPDRWGTNHLFTHARYRNVLVQHCGHPTANFPWYVEGVAALDGRTFMRVGHAQEAVERAIELPPATIEGPLFA